MTHELLVDDKRSEISLHIEFYYKASVIGTLKRLGKNEHDE